MASYLRRHGMLDENAEEEIRAEAKTFVADAVAEMEAMEHPGVEILFDQVYASGNPWTFAEGLEELRHSERPPEVKPMGPQPGASTGDVEEPR